MLKKKFTSNQSSEFKFDVSFLSSGIYFIQTENEVVKFVK